MGQRTFWVLTLDAELELEQFPHPFTRPQAIQARIQALWPALSVLVGAGVVVPGLGASMNITVRVLESIWILSASATPRVVSFWLSSG